MGQVSRWTPRVLNKRTMGYVPASAVLIDRTTIWGNPYYEGRDGTREEVIDKYEEWIKHLIVELPVLYDLEKLRGRDLVCWCAPLACHGDVLLRLANQ